MIRIQKPKKRPFLPLVLVLLAVVLLGSFLMNPGGFYAAGCDWYLEDLLNRQNSNGSWGDSPDQQSTLAVAEALTVAGISLKRETVEYISGLLEKESAWVGEGKTEVEVNGHYSFVSSAITVLSSDVPGNNVKKLETYVSSLICEQWDNGSWHNSFLATADVLGALNSYYLLSTDQAFLPYIQRANEWLIKELDIDDPFLRYALSTLYAHAIINLPKEAQNEQEASQMASFLRHRYLARKNMNIATIKKPLDHASYAGGHTTWLVYYLLKKDSSDFPEMKADLARDVVRQLLDNQRPDGAWGYKDTPNSVYTAGALMMLCVARDYVTGPLKPKIDRAIEGGMNHLNKNRLKEGG